MPRFPLPLLALSLAAAVVTATHSSMGACDPGDLPAAGILEVTTGDGSATFYVDDRNYLSNGIWVYQESNGIWVNQGPGLHEGDVTDHNLQRGNTCGFPGGPCDTCIDIGEWNPDVWII